MPRARGGGGGAERPVATGEAPAACAPASQRRRGRGLRQSRPVQRGHQGPAPPRTNGWETLAAAGQQNSTAVRRGWLDNTTTLHDRWGLWRGGDWEQACGGKGEGRCD